MRNAVSEAQDNVAGDCRVMGDEVIHGETDKEERRWFKGLECCSAGDVEKTTKFPEHRSWLGEFGDGEVALDDADLSVQQHKPSLARIALPDNGFSDRIVFLGARESRDIFILRMAHGILRDRAVCRHPARDGHTADPWCFP